MDYVRRFQPDDPHHRLLLPREEAPASLGHRSQPLSSVIQSGRWRKLLKDGNVRISVRIGMCCLSPARQDSIPKPGAPTARSIKSAARHARDRWKIIGIKKEQIGRIQKTESGVFLISGSALSFCIPCLLYSVFCILSSIFLFGEFPRELHPFAVWRQLLIRTPVRLCVD